MFRSLDITINSRTLYQLSYGSFYVMEYYSTNYDNLIARYSRSIVNILHILLFIFILKLSITLFYMESPFDNYNSHCILYLEPFLNNFHKTYQNVITLSSMPDGPLANLVTTTSTSKLSPFQQLNSISSNPSNCVHVLLRYPKNSAGSISSVKNTEHFMGHDDIPSIFSYLQSNGYEVDTKLTKMLFKSDVVGGSSQNRLSGNKKMICMIRYTN